MELTDDQLKQIAEYMRNEPLETEPAAIELDHTQEHFVVSVGIDGDDVTILCSCGASTKTYGDETEARKEYDKHYEKVMG